MIGGLPPDYVDAWRDQAHKADLTQLSALQSTAQQWGGTIGTLTGAFGLLALVRGTTDVTKLASPWDAGVTGAILLALVLAFVAIVAAAYAAQGSPTTQYGDPLTLRRVTVTAAERARNLLLLSRWAAIGGMILTMAAILTTWRAPQRAAVPPTFLVSPVTGMAAVRCGTIKTAANGVITLLVAGRSPIVLSGGYTFTAISHCP